MRFYTMRRKEWSGIWNHEINSNSFYPRHLKSLADAKPTFLSPIMHRLFESLVDESVTLKTYVSLADNVSVV